MALYGTIRSLTRIALDGIVMQPTVRKQFNQINRWWRTE